MAVVCRPRRRQDASFDMGCQFASVHEKLVLVCVVLCRVLCWVFSIYSLHRSTPRGVCGRTSWRAAQSGDSGDVAWREYFGTFSRSCYSVHREVMVSQAALDRNEMDECFLLALFICPSYVSRRSFGRVVMMMVNRPFFNYLGKVWCVGACSFSCAFLSVTPTRALRVPFRMYGVSRHIHSNTYAAGCALRILPRILYWSGCATTASAAPLSVGVFFVLVV